MSLLPTPKPMSFISTGKILPITGLYDGRRQHHQYQHQPYLSNQPYLLINPDRSLYSNYYLVYVPLIGLPSTMVSHVATSAMSTSLLQASSTLLNSLLTITPLLDTPSLSNALLQKFSSMSAATTSSISSPSSSSSYTSSSISFIREQYRYNMRPSYRYVTS